MTANVHASAAPPHSVAWLRARFDATRPFDPVTIGDGHRLRAADALRPASVLIPVIDRGAVLTVLFTRRTAHLSDHAGQISFPGGRAEPEDPSTHHTALREAEEEIGLAPRHVDILGSLSEYTTVTGYRVTPVVGLLTPPFDLTPDAFEVDEIFEVPLPVLLDERNHLRHTIVHQGVSRQYFALPYERYYIWGATAGMLMNFHRFLIDAQPVDALDR